METSFCELKKKEAVNLADGKRLGRVCDVVFTWPEGRVQGIVVPGGRGMRWGRADLFIDIKCINKIGVDVILVDIKAAPKPDKKGKRWAENSPAPPPPPPREPPPYYRGGDRRDYGDYE